MPLKSYGVLKGRPISSRLGSGSSPHFQIHVVDNTTDFRIAINVKSKRAPSELLYLVVDDFRHPLLERLGALPPGFRPLAAPLDGLAVDFIRGNLFKPEDMRPLAHSIPGPENDLNEKIDAYVRRAIADENAYVYAFGERWGPEIHKKDKYFGFLPGNGIHDIHMNQGNVEQFVKDDGVWQDGCLMIDFPAIVSDESREIWPEQWTAIFLAFQSQAWHTSDRTGHALTVHEPEPVVPAEPPEPPVPVPGPGDRDRHIRIAAALVNPPGHDPSREAVTLINASPAPVDLTGWAIVDRNKKASTIPAQLLEPGLCVRVQLDAQGAQLGNKGGVISLLDERGIKIDGVSYTREQARKQGWTLVF